METLFNHWRFGLNEYKRAFSKRLFLKELNRLIPSLTMDDIIIGRSGVRAMALGEDGEVFDDFKIECKNNSIHVLNAPSPAATACLAIGDEVLAVVKKNFRLPLATMLKLFGFSKKEKVTVKDLASIYSRTLFEVIDLGFPEIIEFVNDNRKFEESPNLKKEDANWFLMIVFAANNHSLSNYFEESIVHRLHHASLNELIKFLALEEDIVRDMFLDYESFFRAIF